MVRVGYGWIPCESNSSTPVLTFLSLQTFNSFAGGRVPVACPCGRLLGPGGAAPCARMGPTRQALGASQGQPPYRESAGPCLSRSGSWRFREGGAVSPGPARTWPLGGAKRRLSVYPCT